MNHHALQGIKAPRIRLSTLDSPLAFLVCWLATGVSLYLAASPPLFPTVFPDELANLSWARFLSGTGPHYVLDMATYRHPIYPALLVPVYWLFSEPADIFRGIFAINTLLVAACLPLAIRLALIGFRLQVAAAWLVGLVVLAYPSLTLVNHHAWPESTLYPLVLVAFLTLSRWLNQSDWRRAAWLGLSCAALYAMHPKMLIFPLVFLGGVAIGLMRNRNAHFRLRALIAILALSLFFLLMSLVGAQTAERLWNASPVDVVGRFTEPHPLDFFFALSSKIAGQFVYAAIITGGLVWLLCATGIQTLWRVHRQGLKTLPRIEWQASVFALMLFLMAVETGVFLLTSERFDTLFYGRHIDPLLAASLIPMLALFLHRRIQRDTVLIALALIGLCLLTLFLTLPVPSWSDFSRVHVQGIGFIMEAFFATHDRMFLLLLISAITIGTGIAGLIALTSLWRWVGLVPLLAMLTLGHITNHPFSGIPINDAIPGEAARTLNARDQCRIVWHSTIRGRVAVHQFYRIQYHFPHCTIESKQDVRCDKMADSEVFTMTALRCPEDDGALSVEPDLWLYLPTR